MKPYRRDHFLSSLRQNSIFSPHSEAFDLLHLRIRFINCDGQIKIKDQLHFPVTCQDYMIYPNRVNMLSYAHNHFASIIKVIFCFICENCHKRDSIYFLSQVERRIISECPSKKGSPNKGKLNLGNTDEGFGRTPDKPSNPDVPPSKRQKLITISEDKPVPNSSKFENDSKEIQSSMASPNTQFSFGSPILGYKAQVFVNASSSSGESGAAAEFLSHPSNQMWTTSSGEPETETWDECFDIDDGKDYTERECGGFDDMADLCKLLKLDGDCLLAPQRCHQSLEMDEPNSAEYQISTFYSKVAQVKGPKSEKEVKALDAWIHHFVDRKKEPFRLVHLLLAKAASQHLFGEIDFPDTSQEFLDSWPSACCKHLECCR